MNPPSGPTMIYVRPGLPDLTLSDVAVTFSFETSCRASEVTRAITAQMMSSEMHPPEAVV
jgi:hypothetical protein